MGNFKHFTSIQIRFADMDALGHVNNANHLSYIELARIRFFTEVVGENINWSKKGIILANTHVDYASPIVLSDELVVGTRCSKLGNKSFTLEYELRSIAKGKERLLATASTVLVCYDYEKALPMTMPDAWRDKLKV